MKFNKTIFYWTLKSKFLVTSLIFGTFVIFSLLYGGLFESTATEFTDLTESFPEEFASIFGDLENSSTPEGWINLEFYSLTLPLTIGVLAVFAGSAIVGKEENDSTLELLLSSPISRTRIFIEKFLAGLAQIFIVCLGAFLGLWISKIIFEPFDLDMTRVLWATFSAFLLASFFYSFSGMIQSLFKSKSIATTVGTAFFVISYLVFVLYRLEESLDFIKYFTPFYYYQVEDIFFGDIEFGFILIFLVLIVEFFTVNLISFKNRDTGV